jgi:hypothetical protein
MTTAYEEAVWVVSARLEGLNSYNAMLECFGLPPVERELSVPVSALRALLAGLPEREGWVLVPRKATQAMLDVFVDLAVEDSGYGLKVADPRSGYTAMLSAAPKP